MSSASKFDYLIVGQGLAGSVLAWLLDQRGKKVLIINSPTLPSASKISAGIFNPLTGKKLVKTWLAEDLFPLAHNFYSGLEKIFDTHLVHDTNIYRPFRNVQEQNAYLSQTTDGAIGQYIANAPDHDKYGNFIQNPHGGLEVTRAGWVDVPEMLHKIKCYFIEKSQYVETEFLYNDLIINNLGVEWKNYQFEKVIFCEGVQARENPFFDWLPYNPVKGQILTVQIDGYDIREIVNQGVWVIPSENGLCRIGATYSWHDLDWQTTADGRAYIENKLQNFLKVPYQVVGQEAGIRPATKERRPILGLHPDHKTLGIFNGLGTKGVTLAPYFATQMVAHLEDGKELSPDVNIENHFSLYFGKEKA